MKRKTFVKQLMALGFSRNEANGAGRHVRWLTQRINETLQGCGFRASWEETLEYVVREIETGKMACIKSDIKMYMDKTARWKAKRSKKMPKERMGAETRWMQWNI